MSAAAKPRSDPASLDSWSVAAHLCAKVVLWTPGAGLSLMPTPLTARQRAALDAAIARAKAKARG